jgi:putative hydrolase
VAGEPDDPFDEGLGDAGLGDDDSPGDDGLGGGELGGGDAARSEGGVLGGGGALGGLNPLAGLPMFGDLAKALSGQGPLNWEAARQFAQLSSTGGASESNVDPTVRIAYTRLAEIAEMHVRDVTTIEAPTATLELTTAGVWAQRTLDAYRPLFTDLAVSLGRPMAGAADDPETDVNDPMMAMMAGLSQMLAPSMMGMAIGSMVGRLATRAFGQYDLPIPRAGANTTLLVVPSAIDAFAEEWSLPVDEMRLWVLAQELIGHAVFSHAPARDAITALVQRHVGGFTADPAGVADKLSSLDVSDADPFQSIQRALSDPEILLGAVRSPEQIEMAPRVEAAIAAVVGYVDYMVDAVAVRVIGGDALRIAEAVRRRRIEASAQDVFIERLLGLQVTAPLVQRGKAFVGGVVDRAGEAALARLFTAADGLPTPSELDAPGLWLARLDLS